MAIGHRGAREKGGGLEEAALDAGIVRLRPVLITVGATIFALVPLAIHGRPLWDPPGVLFDLGVGPQDHQMGAGQALTSRVESRIRDLGLSLAPPKPPVANYLGTKRSGDLLFVAGRVSRLRGEVGSEITTDAARAAARETVLDLLAIIKRDIGDLDRIVSVERMQGFVRSAASFTEHPTVIDGASDLLVELFGEAGRHARTATGAAQLPFGAAVQLDMVLRLAPD